MRDPFNYKHLTGVYTFFICINLISFLSCQTIHDWIAVYPTMFIIAYRDLINQQKMGKKKRKGRRRRRRRRKRGYTKRKGGSNSASSLRKTTNKRISRTRKRRKR